MNPPASSFPEFAAKMRAANASDAAIRAFQHAYERLLAGDTGMIPERDIEPVEQLESLDELPPAPPAAARWLPQTVVVKLNGGLGTSMGLERAKSLLPVKDGLSFLDLIARQVLHLRKAYGTGLRFLVMNSFNTSADTLEHLDRYPELGGRTELELIQNQVPKVDARTLRPVSWPEQPQLEWCPPGHGDIYPCLLGSGWLRRLLDAGVRFAFVSNSDNLGATLDLRLLQWLAQSGKPFVMEVARRTEMDRKGGHLARRGGRYLLRESAQCPETDMAAFQNIGRHRFFNTNNLWIRLDRLADQLRECDGLIPLPLIQNRKTVNPRDPHSAPVVQLETAMGAAIGAFEDADAIVVPRERFVPVKTTSDLVVLRSDAYRLEPDGRVTLARPGQAPPTVELDARHYKLCDDLERAFPQGIPSLCGCRRLSVRGSVEFAGNIRLVGEVRIENSGPTPKRLAEGTYTDTTVAL